MFVDDASLQQSPRHDYMTKHKLHDRMHIQSGAIEEFPSDEKVDLDNPIKKYLASSKKHKKK